MFTIKEFLLISHFFGIVSASFYILGQYNSRHVIKHVTLQFKNGTFSTKVEYFIVLTIFRTN